MEEFTIRYKDLNMTLTQLLLLVIIFLLVSYLIKTRFGGLW